MLTLFVLLFTVDENNAQSRKPNILIIVADDMGYSDLGCFGSEIKTPNIDRLAEEGVRFRQFYNRGRCCPTRASLLTGLYPHNAGLGHMTYSGDWGLPGYRNELNTNCVTIGNVLQSAGYRTLLSGKWHVGETPSNWPRSRGFDEFFGLVQGGGNYFKLRPYGMIARNDTLLTSLPADFYLTDAIGDNAVAQLKSTHTESPGKPFFLYLAFTAPHWPLQAKQQDIRKYVQKYDIGYDAIRIRRYHRMQQLGVISQGTGLSEKEGIVWDKLSDSLKKDLGLRMAVYAAQIDILDQNVGKVINYLRKIGELDNTLIMVLSDNGASSEGGPKGLNNSPLVSGYRDGDPELTGAPGEANSFKSYGTGWANVSNTPFRYYKSFTHEGGIRAPFIVRWPKQLSYAAGSFCDDPADVIDLMPTVIAVSGAVYPQTWHGENIYPLDGISLLPSFQHKSSSEERTLYWVHEGNRAIRSGRWKLVAERSHPWELYDLTIDPSELRNIAANYPEKVAALSEKFETWRKNNNVQDEFTNDSWNRLLKAGETYEERLKYLKTQQQSIR